MTRKLFYTASRGVYWQREHKIWLRKGSHAGRSRGERIALVFDRGYAPPAPIAPINDVVTNTMACLQR